MAAATGFKIRKGSEGAREPKMHVGQTSRASGRAGKGKGKGKEKRRDGLETCLFAALGCFVLNRTLFVDTFINKI